MSARTAPVVLFGFMGTGKSAVGEILARRLQRTYLDSDAEIEREAGAGIPVIFARQGEAGFRRLETQVITRLAETENAVIACGGGAVLRPENLAALRRHGSIHFVLTAQVDTILARTAGSDRPLLQCPPAERRQRVEELLARRAAAYDAAGLAVPTDGMTADEVADAIVRLLNGGMSAQALHATS
ncbi:MAG TPA: shikimate kinase [bacterium]|nr:shikimate kinase [bacterium]